nr:immunoglobulin heavy chain junction region [Macaca mulatta]MOY19081.1 immunoglobulin heavy chain junction region [Macaca mulatta]MOY19278.1 immunoglobulin heavy chain junction region [Macaca mulatta]MOY19571.1 immunoglobulin heavy chain junction region [Macaca mulatta]MOY19637.1 immunoglobulin heavy chain junction region [Macaca mulatta]
CVRDAYGRGLDHW